MSELEIRLSKIAQLKKKVSSLVFFNTNSTVTDFFYLTNTKAQGILVYDFKEPILFVPKMEEQRAKKSWIKNIEILEKEKIKKLLKRKSFGVNYATTSAKNVMKIHKRHDISEQMSSIRAIKTKYEINRIKKACIITKHIFKNISIANRSEDSLAKQIENMIKSQKAEPAFQTIVASCQNAHIPHHEPSNTKIKKPVIVDTGARVDGYCSDVTRTYGADEKLEELINEVFEEVCGKIKPGVKASAIDQIARKKLGKHFITSLGHGIGLNVHEAPSISPKSKDILQPGMVFTIEPGIYIKNKSIRIENDFLLTNSGLKNLTEF